MKTNFRKPTRRLSLMLPFAGYLLLIFMVVSALVGVVILLLASGGSLDLTSEQGNLGSFYFNLVLWSLIIGSILTVLASHLILKPINKILNALNSLAAGDFSARLVFKGRLGRNSTVRELTNSFNTMASELQQTEILRSDFINNFSHEFKTPIVSIAGFAKLLRHGNLSVEEQQEYLRIIEEESLRLSHMASNVLDLTRVENQTILTDCVAFNLSEQIRTCVLMLEGKWSGKHIELSLPDEEFYITGNEELLKLVWINLLDNAIKFSQEYSIVEVKIHQDPDSTAVCISNYGEAIPADKLDKIFRKFYQADESHAAEGNGIGLAIVKKVAELHQGRVQVECAGGKTTFRVLLPQKIA